MDSISRCKLVQPAPTMENRARDPSGKTLIKKEAQNQCCTTPRGNQSRGFAPIYLKTNGIITSEKDTVVTMSSKGKATMVRSSNVTQKDGLKNVESSQTQELRQNWKGIPSAVQDNASASPSSSRLTQDEEVYTIEIYKEQRGLIWDSFDIGKIVNVGFKLEYVAHTTFGATLNIEIELEDISSEVEYWRNSVVC